MTNSSIIIAGLICGAYLLGSIPAGFLLARSQGIDIRSKGSGNIGATNVWRVMGKKWGLTCFVIDFLKGLLPSIAAGIVLMGPLHAALDANQRIAIWLCVAVAAILGHVFPVWLKFKGGKGVATAFGALLGVYPIFTLAAIASLFVWIITLKLTRMVGISSVIAALTLAGLVVLAAAAPAFTASALAGLPGYQPATVVHAGFACVLAALVIFKHRANIVRTLSGTEPKIGARAAARSS